MLALQIYFRHRRCDNPIPLGGGANCKGTIVEGKEEECYAGVECSCKDKEGNSLTFNF